MNDNTALFLFDFDNTLVKGHSHSYIGEQLACLMYLPSGRINFKSHEEYEGFVREKSIDLMKRFLANENLGWKNKEELQDLMKGILASGHKIGVVSFNNYPHAVKYAIEQLFGKEDAEEVYIKSGLPATDYAEIQKCNKVPYIKEVMRNIGITNKANVFFMDDDPKHIYRAFDFLWKFNEAHRIHVDLDELELLVYEKIEFNPTDKNWTDECRKILGEDT